MNARRQRGHGVELLRAQRRLVFGNVALTWREGQNSALDATSIKFGNEVGNVIAQRQRAGGEGEDIPYDVNSPSCSMLFNRRPTSSRPATPARKARPPRRSSAWSAHRKLGSTRNFQLIAS
jgi:hypothetical protein